ETKFLPANSLDAKPFAGGGLLAVQMDSRRLIPNLPSRHIAEYEYLTPLVVFPDEIVKYEEFAMHKVDDQFERFVKEVSAKTGRHFTTEFGLVTSETMNTYYKDGLDLWKDMQKSTRPGVVSCSKAF
ncbi:MAG: hypothetical protein KF789_12415, partial [Bdellovibrionaceae bacterium]|nr:hypothetical protein [Pseudobdellovibrionaceae bacterium]